jgi:cyclohexyl-isocyanide hydratase
MFGARPVDERVVVDGNLITAGGVTAGIDFGLRVLAEVAGADLARATELAIEYDPKSPFECGNPRTAPPELVDKVRRGFAERYAMRKDQIARLVARAGALAEAGAMLNV